MKLLSCEIANFGVLHEERRSFTDGLNTVYAGNGAGKSTLAVFIKAMLFGLPQTTKKKLNDNERKHYKPWQGGAYGGSLCFEANGKRYRIERFFGEKESEDTFALFDLSTNQPSSDYSSHVGHELFGLGADAYERSTYISQRTLPDKPEDDDLGVKLTHLIEESGDLSTLEDALAILEKRRMEYQVRGGRGLISDTEREITDTENRILRLHERISDLQKARAELSAEKEKQSKNQADRAAYDRKVKTAAEEASKREIIAHYRDLGQDAQKLASELQEVRAFFGGTVPSAGEISEKRADNLALVGLAAQMQHARLSRNEEERLSQLSGRFSDGVPPEEDLNAARRLCRQAEQLRNENKMLQMQADSERRMAAFQKSAEPRKPVRPLLLVLGILGVLLFVGGAVLLPLALPVPGIILMICGAALTVTGIVSSVKTSVGQAEPPETDPAAAIADKIRENQSILCGWEQQVAKLAYTADELPSHIRAEDLPDALDRLSATVREYQTLIARKEECRRMYCALEARSDELSDALHAYLSRWFDPDSAEPGMLLGQLEAKVGRLSQLSEAVHTATKRAEAYRMEHDLPAELPEDTPPRAELSAALLDAEYARINDETNHVSAAVARLERLISDNDGVPEELGEAEARLDVLREQLTRYRYRLTVIENTSKYLKQARSELSARYLGAMQSGFRRYFAALTGEDADSYEMDTGFGVKLRKNGKSYGSEYLSRGYRDAIDLCTRFALTDALFEEEKPFLILDDPLVNLDDEKQKNAAGLLHAASEQFQILYLVCSQSRM